MFDEILNSFDAADNALGQEIEKIASIIAPITVENIVTSSSANDHLFTAVTSASGVICKQGHMVTITAKVTGDVNSNAKTKGYGSLLISNYIPYNVDAIGSAYVNPSTSGITYQTAINSTGTLSLMPPKGAELSSLSNRIDAFINISYICK